MANKACILLIEDNDEDFYATQRAFAKADFDAEIYRCADGEKALNFLYHRGEYSDRNKTPRPQLILLDLNLPMNDGRAIIGEIKTDLALRDIPVVVLTTSDNERDINECYLKGANSYIKKSIDMDQFIDTIKRLKQYWFETVELPTTL